MDYKADNVTLMLGDCLDRMKEIPDESINLTVTSPPYDNLRTYKGNNSLWGEHVWRDVIAELYRVTAEGGVVVWVVADATIKGSETGTSFRQALHAMECGFRLHDTMIWNKGAFAAPCKTRYGSSFEYMFVFSKGAPEVVNKIRDRKNKKKAGEKLFRKKRLPDGTFESRERLVIREEYGQRFNVWEMPPVQSSKERTGHPAQFPQALAGDHVRSWSRENDVVLDPFMGSGTTGAACASIGRKFVGVEMDEGYFEIAKDRIQTAQNENS